MIEINVVNGTSEYIIKVSTIKAVTSKLISFKSTLGDWIFI